MVRIINEYLISDDLNYYGYIQNYRDELLNLYFKNNNQKKNFDCILDNSDINNYLTPKLNALVEKIFWVGPTLLNFPISFYVQNNQNQNIYLHNHSRNPGTVQAIFYLDIPKKGGETLFKLEFNGEEQDYILKPQLNKVYFFPSWIYHTALPQQDECYRISFNWRHGSNQRPIVKGRAIQW